jgi:hypothetical protein
MDKIEFFIERRAGAYVLADANGDLHVEEYFADKQIAADTAVRFAQAQDATYSIYY